MHRPLLAALLALTLTACPIDPCPPGGMVTLTITSTGLPAGVSPALTVQGVGDAAPRAVDASGTITVSGGPVAVRGSVVTSPDPLVRRAWAPTLTSSDAAPAPLAGAGAGVCARPGAPQAVSVTWSEVPTGHHLWVTSVNASAQLIGFDAATLASSATQPPPVVSRGPLGGAIAFDREGNLWALGGTATLARFPAAGFAASQAVTPDTEVSLDLGCVPLSRDLAFDRAGNAYVSSPCRDAVYRLSAAELAPSAAGRVLTPTWSLSVLDPVGLAFDAAGNLWVASSSAQRVLRFDAASLAGATAPAAAGLQLGVFARDLVGDTTRFSPSWLAFDARGDLWANDFAANTFYRVPVNQLGGAGVRDVQPAVRLVVDVLAVIEGFAFDEQGGLWTAGAQGSVLGFSPAQLAAGSTAGAPVTPQTVLGASGALGSAVNLAVFPAPVGTPLFHALP